MKDPIEKTALALVALIITGYGLLIYIDIFFTAISLIGLVITYTIFKNGSLEHAFISLLCWILISVGAYIGQLEVVFTTVIVAAVIYIVWDHTRNDEITSN